PAPASATRLGTPSRRQDTPGARITVRAATCRPPDSDSRRWIVGGQGGRGLGEDEAGPEQPRLLEGAEGQIITANPVREPGIVTDQGAGSRRSAEDLRLQH